MVAVGGKATRRILLLVLCAHAMVARTAPGTPGTSGKTKAAARHSATVAPAHWAMPDQSEVAGPPESAPLQLVGCFDPRVRAQLPYGMPQTQGEPWTRVACSTACADLGPRITVSGIAGDGKECRCGKTLEGTSRLLLPSSACRVPCATAGAHGGHGSARTNAQTPLLPCGSNNRALSISVRIVGEPRDRKRFQVRHEC